MFHFISATGLGTVGFSAVWPLGMETGDIAVAAVAAVVGAIVGVAICLAGLKIMGRSALQQGKQQADQLIERANAQASELRKQAELDAKAEHLKAKELADKEADAIRTEMKATEQRLIKREDMLDRKLDTLSMKEKNLEGIERSLTDRTRNMQAKDQQLDQVLAQQKENLLRIANMSMDDAKAFLMSRIENDVRHEAAVMVDKITEQAKDEAKQKSTNILLQAMQRYAAEVTSEGTTKSVEIPSDDMKGRIIGREGRNIRAFEQATGVDVIIDDTPGVITVNCFDPVRREIAKVTMEKLIADGRIHPARIEEIVDLTQKEMEVNIRQLGKKATIEANVTGLHPKVAEMLGRLHYRTSYGQNVLRHSMEVAYLSQMIADELRLDGNLARRAGLLHDIGKAMDHDQEGGHPALGMEFCRKFNEPETVLNAIGGHHNDIPSTSPYTPIIMAADAISGARPGARRETLERYIKRLQELEGIAMSFPGVRAAFAIQAGREVRVIVDPERCDDPTATMIARDVAKRIQNEMTYPGEIKVTVLREVRAVDFAR
jgi:ribonuclease Y